MRLSVILLLLPGLAFAQGFAGLGTDADGFALPDRATSLTFPEDHGAHEDFRIEWWYLTANLTADDGTQYGVQWTLFRAALAPGDGEGWASPQMWMGHAALTSETAHHMDERLARGGTGIAGVTADPFAAWIGDWQMDGTPCAPPCDPSDTLTLTASGPAFAWELMLEADGPIVLNGDDGYSVKSPEGAASHYYSRPYRVTAGTITLPDEAITVTGHGWLDREWSSQPLSPQQEGWDWFTLRLDSGAHLMAFQLRESDRPPFASGTFLAPDGTTTPVTALTLTPLQTAQAAGRDIPVSWSLNLPDHDLTITALNPDAWMEASVPYWEGPVRVTGSDTGMGYLEMTGY